MKVFFQIAVFSLAFFVQSAPIFAQDAPVNWANISDSVYLLEYPENWEVNKTSDIGINLVALSPLDKSGDKFRENLTLVVQDMKAGETAESLGRNSVAEIVSILQGSKLEAQGYVEKGENSYYRAVYTGDQYGMNLRYEQRYFSKGTRAYILVMACEVDSYDNYEKDFERIFGSFAFKD